MDPLRYSLLGNTDHVGETLLAVGRSAGLPVKIDNCQFQIEWDPVKTALSGGVLHIVRLGAKEQVLDVAAGVVVACMANLHAGRDRTIDDMPNDSVDDPLVNAGSDGSRHTRSLGAAVHKASVLINGVIENVLEGFVHTHKYSRKF